MLVEDLNWDKCNNVSITDLSVTGRPGTNLFANTTVLISTIMAKNS